jgi:hypothetical protein
VKLDRTVIDTVVEIWKLLMKKLRELERDIYYQRGGEKLIKRRRK